MVWTALHKRDKLASSPDSKRSKGKGDKPKKKKGVKGGRIQAIQQIWIDEETGEEVEMSKSPSHSETTTAEDSDEEEIEHIQKEIRKIHLDNDKCSDDLKGESSHKSQKGF